MAARGRGGGERQRQAIGHAQLLDHQVHARRFLGYRVLDLQARVHFKERDLAALPQQKLHRARTLVSGGGTDGVRRRVHLRALGLGEEGRRRFFDQLLVAPLQRAVARADDDDVAMAVGEDLRLDVARLMQELLDETLATAKRGGGLAHGGVVEFGHFFDAPRDFQPAPAAAKSRLDRDRQAVLPGKGQHLGGVLDRASGARDQRRTHFERDGARCHLVAELGHGDRARAYPRQARIQHRLGEVGALGEEAVAGVQRICAAAPGDGEQLGNVEIRIRRARAFECPGLIRRLHVQRVGIGVGINGD